jgi:MFS family permease
MNDSIVEIPPRTIRRYMNYMITAAVIWCVFGTTISGPIFSGLLLALNLSKAQIGFVMSLGLLFLPMQMIGALIQKQFFHRKKFWFVCVFIHYSCFFFIAALTATWMKLPASLALSAFMLLYAASQCSAQLSGAVGSAWTGDLIPPRESTDFWNRRTAMVLLANMVAGIVMGKVVDILGKDERSTYAITMGVGALFGYFSMFSNVIMRDPYPHPVRGESPFKQIREIISSASFRQVTAFFSFQSMAAWVASGFIFVYLQKDMNFSMTSIQILLAIACMVGFFAAFLFRIIGSKYGNKPVLVLCTLLKSVEFVLYAQMLPGNGMLDELGIWFFNHLSVSFGLPPITFQPGLISAIPVFIMGGLVNIGLGSSQMAIITSTGNRKLRSLSIGIFYSMTGIAGFIVSSQSGLLYEYLDTLDVLRNSRYNSFSILAAITALGYFLSVFIIARLREDGAAPTVDVVKTLFSSNPIRSIYHAHLLSQPMNEFHREETLRRAHGSLIANELISDLYSPSSRIRDGALLNIGRMENEVAPELVEEVIKLLDIPELGMQAIAARSLGRLRTESAIPALIRHFDDDDLALAQACLSAASWIGSQEAENSICAILRNPRRRSLWPIAAEALSRIGDHRYVRLVFPLIENERYRVLKLQALISICRLLLPTKSKIHPLFEAEERLPGVEIERLLKQFCNHPIWMATSADRLNFEELITLYDHSDMVGCMERILPPQLALYNIRKPAHAEPGAFLGERFVPGRMRESGLNSDSYPAVSIWLQLKLWALLRYDPGETDRFVFLTALIAAERLVCYRYSHTDEL